MDFLRVVWNPRGFATRLPCHRSNGPEAPPACPVSLPYTTRHAGPLSIAPPPARTSDPSRRLGGRCYTAPLCDVRAQAMVSHSSPRPDGETGLVWTDSAATNTHREHGSIKDFGGTIGKLRCMRHSRTVPNPFLFLFRCASPWTTVFFRKAKITGNRRNNSRPLSPRPVVWPPGEVGVCRGESVLN